MQKFSLEKDGFLYLAVIFVIGAVAGFWLKSALKPHITNAPDDRKVVAITQSFDFKAAQAKLEAEMAAGAADSSATGDSTGANVAAPVPAQQPQGE